MIRHKENNTGSHKALCPGVPNGSGSRDIGVRQLEPNITNVSDISGPLSVVAGDRA